MCFVLLFGVRISKASFVHFVGENILDRNACRGDAVQNVVVAAHPPSPDIVLLESGCAFCRVLGEFLYDAFYSVQNPIGKILPVIFQPSKPRCLRPIFWLSETKLFPQPRPCLPHDFLGRENPACCNVGIGFINSCFFFVSEFVPPITCPSTEQGANLRENCHVSTRSDEFDHLVDYTCKIFIGLHSVNMWKF